MNTRVSAASEKGGATSKGIPSRWDSRIAISIPAFLVLLVIASGLANYLTVTSVTSRLDAIVSGRILADLETRILVQILVFSAIGLIAGLALVWTILPPIRRLAEAAAQMARGEYSGDLQFRAGYEIDQLGRTFNSMATYLREAIAEREACLWQGMRTATILVDRTGKILSVDDAAYKMLGAGTTRFEGMTLEGAISLGTEVARVLLGHCHGVMNGELEVAEGAEVRLRESDTKGKPYSVVFSRLAAGEGPDGLVLFQLRDLSPLRSLNAMFSRTDHLAALGAFTLGLSHELRNPLGAIKAMSQMLEERLNQQESATPFLQRIVREVDRVDLLVKELHDYSRTPGGPRENVGINRLTFESLRNAIAGLPDGEARGKKILEEYAEGLPDILGQPERLMRALRNVLINAFEHTKPGDTIRLSTSKRMEKDGAAVQIEVENSGSSIKQEDLPRIFEPFFSTRKGGTGLGLAIAYQIVVQNGGTLRVESQDGTTRFVFAFHVVDR